MARTATLFFVLAWFVSTVSQEMVFNWSSDPTNGLIPVCSVQDTIKIRSSAYKMVRTMAIPTRSPDMMPEELVDTCPLFFIGLNMTHIPGQELGNVFSKGLWIGPQEDPGEEAAAGEQAGDEHDEDEHDQPLEGEGADGEGGGNGSDDEDDDDDEWDNDDEEDDEEDIEDDEEDIEDDEEAAENEDEDAHSDKSFQGSSEIPWQFSHISLEGPAIRYVYQCTARECQALRIYVVQGLGFIEQFEHEHNNYPHPGEGGEDQGVAHNHEEVEEQGVEEQGLNFMEEDEDEHHPADEAVDEEHPLSDVSFQGDEIHCEHIGTTYEPHLTTIHLRCAEILCHATMTIQLHGEGQGIVTEEFEDHRNH